MRLTCWHAHEGDWPLMVAADNTQLSTASSLGCALKAAPHVAGLSHTVALSPAAPYSRRILAAVSHAAALSLTAALSPRSCTFTTLSLHNLTQLHSLTAASHGAWLSHTAALSLIAVLSLLSHTVACSLTAALFHIAAPSHTAALRPSHSCARCTLTRNRTLLRKANSDCRTLGYHSLPHIIICCAGFGSLRNGVEWSHGGNWQCYLHDWRILRGFAEHG